MKVGRQGLADARGDRRWGIGASTQPASNQPQLSAIYTSSGQNYLPTGEWSPALLIMFPLIEKASAGGDGDGKSTAVQYTSDDGDDAAVTATAATMHTVSKVNAALLPLSVPVCLATTHTHSLSSMT